VAFENWKLEARMVWMEAESAFVYSARLTFKGFEKSQADSQQCKFNGQAQVLSAQ
jgi:hypothetical protein